MKAGEEKDEAKEREEKLNNICEALKLKPTEKQLRAVDEIGFAPPHGRAARASADWDDCAGKRRNK